MTVEGLYSIWDRKASYYLPVMQIPRGADAVRQFTDIVMSSETPISKYPADFDLVSVGVIDVETGVITPTTPPTVLLNGLACLEMAERERSRYRAALDDVQVMNGSADPS